MNLRYPILILIAATIATTTTAQKRKTYKKRPSSTYAAPQTKLEDLPRRPIDTILTADPETKVIIFSNNTWEFFRPEISERLANHAAYKYNWDTVSIFAYRNIELADLPQIVELKLVDSLSEFCPPLIGRVGSKYGPRGRVNHQGTDIPLRLGEPLLAMFEGKVRYAKFNSGGFGYLTIIRHPNGLESWYGHQSRINVKPGTYVKAGQVIGYGGSTGRSTGPHLHFELRYQDQSFDPEFVVDFENGQLRYQKFALEKKFFNIHSRASELLDEDYGDLISAPGSLLSEANDSTVKKVITAPKPAVTQAVYHKIVQNDNLGKLAGKYRVSVDQICRLNKITRTTTLKLGRSLRIK